MVQQTAPAPDRARTRVAVRAAIAGGIGTVIEYYDFTVYAYLSIVIGPLFFPSGNPAVSTLSALGVFAGAYVVRPFGGIFFGRVGDRRGRRAALVATVVMTGTCSVLMGLLPTYATIGVLAPVLLVIVRALQGFAAGGEVGGAMTYIIESAPAHRRAFFGAFTPIGTNLGFVLSSSIVGAMTLFLSPAQMSAWGWRIPFLICLPLTVVVLVIRLKIQDTEEFLKIADEKKVSKAPFLQMLRTSWRSILVVLGIGITTNGVAYLGSTYMSIYLQQIVGLPASIVYWMTAGSILALCIAMPFVGLAADRFGRRRVFVFGAVALIIITYPMLGIIGTASVGVIMALFVLYMLLSATLQVPVFTTIPELFPGPVRYTGVSFGFNVATVVAGATSPLVATALVAGTGNHQSPAFWVIGVCIIGLVTVFTMRWPDPKRVLTTTIQVP
ncbi:MFS transporter [Microbacterium capsulatum]|uniref:MFS transporter n=1 Tax=Microbacterium capsulatum TaxID=3041921 RepID=A0ABU0XFD3_9MICO|nr:MFS transporter [Microbacterium sp. ASV81]MDQ4212910.1 MFS transporter [Microbacterium sp. ASV81]